MPLKDYEPETQEVKIGRSNFYVRGLSLNDVTVILRTHGADIERMVEMFNNMAATAKSADLGGDLISMMLTDMPLLTAKVILQASGEDVDLSKVERLPLPVQMDALEKIVKLTFEEVGGVKKFVQQLARLMKEMGFSVPPANVSGKMIGLLKRSRTG